MFKEGPNKKMRILSKCTTILASMFLLTGMLMNTESNSAAVRNLFNGAMKYYQERREG